LTSGTGGRRGGLKDQCTEGSFSGELAVDAPKTSVGSLKIAQERKSNGQRSISCHQFKSKICIKPAAQATDCRTLPKAQYSYKEQPVRDGTFFLVENLSAFYQILNSCQIK